MNHGGMAELGRKAAMAKNEAFWDAFKSAHRPGGTCTETERIAIVPASADRPDEPAGTRPEAKPTRRELRKKALA